MFKPHHTFHHYPFSFHSRLKAAVPCVHRHDTTQSDPIRLKSGRYTSPLLSVSHIRRNCSWSEHCGHWTLIRTMSVCTMQWNRYNFWRSSPAKRLSNHRLYLVYTYLLGLMLTQSYPEHTATQQQSYISPQWSIWPLRPIPGSWQLWPWLQLWK